MPSVEGAYTWPNTRGVPPGAQQVHVIDAVRAAHHARNDRGQLPGRVHRTRRHPAAGQVDTLADQTAKDPGCSANSSTGTKPAANTRFCSSKTAEPMANVCDDCTENAFRRTDDRDLPITIVPAQKAFSRFTRRSPRRLFHGPGLELRALGSDAGNALRRYVSSGQIAWLRSSFA
jgi:hypothetical protein